jgi:hypothetical protein
MLEDAGVHTSEYTLKEAQSELAQAHHRNAMLCNQLRVIKASRWYRFGKFIRLAP